MPQLCRRHKVRITQYLLLAGVCEPVSMVMEAIRTTKSHMSSITQCIQPITKSQRLHANSKCAQNCSHHALFQACHMHFTAYGIKQGITNTGAGSANIIKTVCMKDKFVLATDCENMCGAPFTCYSSEPGGVMTSRRRNVWVGSTANTAPSHIHTVLHYDARVRLTYAWSQVMGGKI